MENLSKFIQQIILTGLILLVFLVPIIPNINITNYKLFIAQVIIVVLFLLWMFRVLVLGERIIKTSLNIPLLVFVLLTTLSYFLSDIKSASLEQLFRNFILVSLVFIGINNISSERHLNYILNSWIISASIVALYGIFQVYPGGTPFSFSTYGNPNLLASFLVITLPVTFGKFIASSHIVKKIILGIISIVILLCIILTFSRGGIVSLICGVVIFVFLYILTKVSLIRKLRTVQKAGFSDGIKRSTHYKKRLIVYLVLIFLIFSILTYFLYFLPEVEAGFNILLSKEFPRIYIWQGAMELIKQRPLFGYGIGTFVAYFPEYRPAQFLSYHPPFDQFVRHTHNEFLEITHEMGIVGLATFLWIVFMAIKQGLTLSFSVNPVKNQKFSNGVKQKYWQPIIIGLITSIIAVLIHNLVSVSLRFTGINIFFFLCIAIIGIISRMDTKQ